MCKVMDIFFSVYMYKLKLYGALCSSTGLACLKGLGKKIYTLDKLLILVITPPRYLTFFINLRLKVLLLWSFHRAEQGCIVVSLDMLCLKKHLFSFAKRIGFKLLKRLRVMLYSLCITYKCLYKNISLQNNNFSYLKKHA